MSASCRETLILSGLPSVWVGAIPGGDEGVGDEFPDSNTKIPFLVNIVEKPNDPKFSISSSYLRPSWGAETNTEDRRAVNSDPARRYARNFTKY